MPTEFVAIYEAWKKKPNNIICGQATEALM